MKHISELATILNQHFNWNKARITCLAQMIKGLIAVKTVNLMQLATSFSSNALGLSSYRRIQRFFQIFSFDPSKIVYFVLALFPLPKHFLVIMDHTNWKLGCVHFNLLVLSIAYQGIALPIYWMNLGKPGTSHRDHRIYSLLKVLQTVGKKRIACLLADREFLGKKWFQWLIESHIHFAIRIKENIQVKRHLQDRFSTPISGLFRHLNKGQRKFFKEPVWLDECPIYLSARCSLAGKLFIVATDQFDRRSLKNYQRRWEIENLFSCMKTKGFCLEDTHLSQRKKVEKLLFVVVIAFCWSYAVGIKQNQDKEIAVKTHQRKSRSLFRYGYDLLRRAVFQGLAALSKYYEFLIPKTFHPARRAAYE